MKFTNIHIKWTDTGAKILATIPLTCPICGITTEPKLEHVCGDMEREARIDANEAKVDASIQKTIDLVDALRADLEASDRLNPRKAKKRGSK